ncbi:MAG: hypothetical protein BA872_08305 [Desulfobacterales bacterium C00003060]|nr:MAG: hypothetical protein BA872_08305 [Desulfobacterales bacterium C00003060]
MKRKSNYRYLLIPLFIFIFTFSSTAFAQELSEEGAEDLITGDERIEPDDFGTAQYAVTFIPAADFQQRGSSSFNYYLGGYVYRTGGASMWWAPVNVPNGVDIYRVRMYSYDNSTANVGHYLTRYTGSATTQDLGNTSTSGTPGYTSVSFDPAHIIDNRYGYVINCIQSTTTSETMIRGARISWRRVIGPAGGQVFWDVPPTHTFFREINNLARSGVTTGWPDGSFRPSWSVTREAMAAFMSRFGGLAQGYDTADP